MGRQDFYKHKACLEDLIGLQRRQFLMKMLTLSPSSCLDQVKSWVSDAQQNFSDFIYQLINDVCSIATSKSGFASYQEDVKSQIKQLIEHLKVNDAAIASGFLTDLLTRAKISTKKKFNQDVTKCQNSDLLNPANLGFFVELIQ